MLLRFAVSLFVLASLFSLPAAAKDQEAEGKVESLSVTVNGGFSFRLESGAALCSDGKIPIARGGLVSQVIPGARSLTQQTPDWIYHLLLEATRSGRSVRVLSTPDGPRSNRYCRIVGLTLL